MWYSTVAPPGDWQWKNWYDNSYVHKGARVVRKRPSRSLVSSFFNLVRCFNSTGAVPIVDFASLITCDRIPAFLVFLCATVWGYFHVSLSMSHRGVAPPCEWNTAEWVNYYYSPLLTTVTLYDKLERAQTVQTSAQGRHLEFYRKSYFLPSDNYQTIVNHGRAITIGRFSVWRCLFLNFDLDLYKVIS